MLELTPANAADYLRRQGWIGPGPVAVEALERRRLQRRPARAHSESVFVLKQSRPQLRTRDAWFSDLDRVYREQEVMQVLQPLLPPETVPQVLFSDRAEYVFAMSSAPDDARPWKESLLAGANRLRHGRASRRRPRPDARRHGPRPRPHRRLPRPGRLRAAARRSVLSPHPGTPAGSRVAVAPTHRRLAVVDARRSATAITARRTCSSHEHGFTLVDYETAHQGDPTMDLGFFLSHLLLKAARRPAERRRYFDLTRSLLATATRSEAKFAPLAELEKRGIAHCGLCLLARIDGTSPGRVPAGRAETRGGAPPGPRLSAGTAGDVGRGAGLGRVGVQPLAATEMSA